MSKRHWTTKLPAKKLARINELTTLLLSAEKVRLDDCLEVGKVLLEMQREFKGSHFRTGLTALLHENTMLHIQSARRYIAMAEIEERHPGMRHKISSEAMLELVSPGCYMRTFERVKAALKRGERVTKDQVREWNEMSRPVRQPKGRFRPLIKEDMLGQAIPEHLVGVFSSLAGWNMTRPLKGIKQAIKKAAQDYIQWCKADILRAAVKEIDKTALECKPFCVCPECEGKRCPWCRRTGWMPRFAYESWKAEHPEWKPPKNPEDIEEEQRIEIAKGKAERKQRSRKAYLELLKKRNDGA